MIVFLILNSVFLILVCLKGNNTINKDELISLLKLENDILRAENRSIIAELEDCKSQ